MMALVECQAPEVLPLVIAFMVVAATAAMARLASLLMCQSSRSSPVRDGCSTVGWWAKSHQAWEAMAELASTAWGTLIWGACMARLSPPVGRRAGSYRGRREKEAGELGGEAGELEGEAGEKEAGERRGRRAEAGADGAWGPLGDCREQAGMGPARAGAGTNEAGKEEAVEAGDGRRGRAAEGT